MKKVELSKYEMQVILDHLGLNLCSVHCWCGYKGNWCYEYKANGEPKCKLQKTILDIEKKLGGAE